MVKPASLRWLRQPITAFAILLIGLPAFAQEAPKPSAVDTSAPGFDEPVFLPLEFRPPEDTLSVGIRFSGKARVTFQGLGTIFSNWSPGLLSDKTITSRSYADGQVSTDVRYRLDGNPVNDGLTNTWNMNADAGHVVPDTTQGLPAGSQAIAFHAYQTESSGASVTARSGATPSWDVEFNHRLGGKKIIWGVVLGAGLSDISAKAAATLQTNLRVVTHYYSLYGAPAPGITINADGTTTPSAYSAPSSTLVDLYDENGNLSLAPNGSPVQVGRDTTVLLSQQPYAETNVIDPTPMTFTGKWEVKGAFITVRVGPYVQADLSKRITVRASAGATFTLVGARIRVQETATMPGSVGDLSIAGETENNTTAKFGAFGSGEVDWMLTKHTGFFLGAIYEQYSGSTDLFVHAAPTPASFDRVAKLNTSAGLGFRLGLTARF